MYKKCLPIPIIGVLVLLAITPVYASPGLNLGSTASYSLNGSITATQNCTANPLQYLPQACYGTGYPSNSYVSIYDDSHCFPSSYNSTSVCSWVPSYVTVYQGSWVYWTNYGNLTHMVTENMNISSGPNLGSLGPLRPGSDGGFMFNEVGTYYLYDSLYPNILGLRGTVAVIGTAPTNTTPTSVTVDLSGTIGWKIEGLSTSQANLLVSHSIALSISPSVLISFTPVTESGSFEQSINLSTRVESPGTASSIVMTALSAYLPSVKQLLTGTSQYGTTTGSARDPFVEPSYTQWWVNGPLSNGTPVQILQGWSSVTGSSNQDFGGNIGTRQAWIVTSHVNQTFNLNIPNLSIPLGPSSTSTAKASIGFQWSFDKTADLLLRNNDTISFSTLSINPSTIYAGAGPINVSVIRTMSATATLTLQLSSTSLNLTGAQQSPNLNPIIPMSWMSVGLVGLAAGVISGALLWQGHRTRRSVEPGKAPSGLTPF